MRGSGLLFHKFTAVTQYIAYDRIYCSLLIYYLFVILGVKTAVPSRFVTATPDIVYILQDQDYCFLTMDNLFEILGVRTTARNSFVNCISLLSEFGLYLNG